MYLRFVRASLAFAVVISIPAWSQAGGAGSAPAPAGSNAPAGNRGVTTPMPGTRPVEPAPPPEFERPVFLSGRVVKDDGSPATENVAIESVCNGSTRIEGYADPKGRFSFQLGQVNNGVMQDASVGSFDTSYSRMSGAGTSSNSSRLGQIDRMRSCELQAKLAGYRSDVVMLATRRAMDSPDVGTIVLHHLGDVQGSTVSASNLAAPKDARKAYEKGLDAEKKNKNDEALKQFAKATELYPGYASAWAEVGRLQSLAGQSEEARSSLQKAIQADAKYIPPYLTLATLEARERRWPQLAEVTGQILKLDAFDYPQIHLYRAVAQFNMGKMDEAEKSAREAEKLDTRKVFPQTWHLLGAILANKREFAGAVQNMRTYMTLVPNPSEAERSQLAQWESLASQSLANRQ